MPKLAENVDETADRYCRLLSDPTQGCFRAPTLRYDSELSFRATAACFRDPEQLVCLKIGSEEKGWATYSL